MTRTLSRIRLHGISPGRWKTYDGAPPHPVSELLAREVVRLAFYMPHDHPELSSGVSHAIDCYMRAVGEGPETINRVHFSHDEGTGLTEESWNYVRGLLQATKHWCFPDDYDDAEQRLIEKRGFERGLLFTGGIDSRNGYQLEYRARIPWRSPRLTKVSLLTATLPTEYLEAHGPASVSHLARTMASQLRFATGHMGLALQLYGPLPREDENLRAAALRHPGLDLRPTWDCEADVGFHIDGIHWMNFFAPPVVEKLGGARGLREKLHSAETTVEEFGKDRVLVTLGEWPEAGDLHEGQTLPAYQELARVLEPWLEPLHRASPDTWMAAGNSSMHFTEDDALRWWRRFLDRG